MEKELSKTLRDKTEFDKAYNALVEAKESVLRQKEESEKRVLTKKLDDLTKDKKIVLENSTKRRRFAGCP